MWGLRRARATEAPAASPTLTPSAGVELAELIPVRSDSAYLPWQIPPVIASRLLLANLAAQLPLLAIRDGEPITPTPALLARPDPRWPAWQSVFQLVMDLTRLGRAHLWVRPDWRDSVGHATRAQVAHPEDVGARFDLWGDPIAWEFRDAVWEPDQMLHMPLWVDRDPLGEGPLQTGAARLAQLVTLYNYCASMWSEGVPASAVVNLGQYGNATAAKKTRQDMMESRNGQKTPMVLWGGAAVDFPGQTAVESETVRMLGEARAEVGLMFGGIPPAFLNAPVSSSLTYATLETESRQLLLLVLQPILDRIEAAFTDLLPRGQVARFNLAELSRTTAKERAEIYRYALNGEAWMTVDQVRHIEGWGPMTEGAGLPAVDVLPELPSITRRAG